LRSIINQSLADVIAKAEIGVLDLAAHYPMLSEQVRTLVRERIDDEYGLEIPQLVIVNISVPAEVEQALDARASMSLLGDLAAYQQYQVGAATPVAAANPAGGLAAAGVGVGMGMAIAGRVAPGARAGCRRRLRRRRGTSSSWGTRSDPGVRNSSPRRSARAASGPTHSCGARAWRAGWPRAACPRSRRCSEVRPRRRGDSPPIALELRHEREQLERVRRRRGIAELAVERGHVHGDPLRVAPRRIIVERDRARGVLAREPRGQTALRLRLEMEQIPAQPFTLGRTRGPAPPSRPPSRMRSHARAVRDRPPR
jgi:hypothetical protein